MKVDKLFAARQPRHHAGQAKELTLPEAQIGALVGHLATTQTAWEKTVKPEPVLSNIIKSIF